MKNYPAIDVAPPADPDLLLASSTTSVRLRSKSATRLGPHLLLHDRPTATRRTRALAQAVRRHCIDVPDEDWARRSQENLQPVTVGRITVAPPWASAPTQAPCPPRRHRHPLRWASAQVTTPRRGCAWRRCRHRISTDRFVLDVGTGSGVLAIAAVGWARSGAGIDNDPTRFSRRAKTSRLNPAAVRTRIRGRRPHRAARCPLADVVTANLTGALLVRAAALLRNAVRRGDADPQRTAQKRTRRRPAAFGSATIVRERGRRLGVHGVAHWAA